MKNIFLVIGLMSMPAFAKSGKISAAEIQRLDTELAQLFGAELQGSTPDGVDCSVVYKTTQVLSRGRPTGHSYKQLVIQAPGSFKCGNGRNIDVVGLSNPLRNLEMDSSGISVEESVSYDDGWGNISSHTRRLNVELSRRKALSAAIDDCSCSL